jgi:hypothetical protein
MRLDSLTPNARTGWQTYTPTWTSDGTAPAIGNGTLTGMYRMLDENQMEIYIRFARGSTSTNGTGTYRFSLPSGYKTSNTAPYNSFATLTSAWVIDSGTLHYSCTGYADPNTTYMLVMVADRGPWTGTNPFTLATGDTGQINGTIFVQPV